MTLLKVMGTIKSKQASKQASGITPLFCAARTAKTHKISKKHVSCGEIPRQGVFLLCAESYGKCPQTADVEIIKTEKC